ncbi:hypothetical protein LQ318_14025 [Aliifodinibius salicampi]|uniref:SatD family (SatD) n=1 Tax=Fodinibius salicampi TaxID=1920655 RepID=A0ABT3Q1M9_9BACT|nr:hypothetical protein [Fodinibius salicampi]MCW9714025.1 hypothetical protein [Fodinibius salicampi]
MPAIAVLTTDVVDSTKLSSGDFDQLMEVLQAELSDLQEEELVRHYELYRGDSAQLVTDYPARALEIAFRLKTAVRQIMPQDMVSRRGKSTVFDIRTAIGLGKVESVELNDITNTPPFVRSGRCLDTITEKGLGTGIFSDQEQLNAELSTELYLYEWIIEQWSLSAARIVYKKLKGLKEREIAEEFGISQSAVNQHSQATHWKGLRQMLERYENLIKWYYE